MYHCQQDKSHSYSYQSYHHLAEGIFKAFARSLKQAVRRDVFSYDLPSSKGLL